MATSDEQRDQALLYAVGLARALHAAHYSEVEYWEPLTTVLGVLTQIDNMCAGLVRAQQAPQERADEQFLYPTKEQIAEAHNRIEALLPEDEPDLVPDWVCTVLINYGRALAANPQQIASGTKGGGERG